MKCKYCNNNFKELYELNKYKDLSGIFFTIDDCCIDCMRNFIKDERDNLMISVIELDNFLETLQISFDNKYLGITPKMSIYQKNLACYTLLERIRNKIKDVVEYDKRFT